MMNKPLIVTSHITIGAPAEAVWDALVNPQKTKKYMFGCETVSDWNVGSELLWRGVYEGRPMVFVKGRIVEIIAGKRLSYTTIDPNSGMEDLPENYLTVTYALSPQDNGTMLVITQGDFSTVANGEKRFRETLEGGGWQPILDQIRSLVEAS